MDKINFLKILEEKKDNKYIPLITIIIGTRPELIKLAPVIKVFQNYKKVKTRIILTGQHREMLCNLMKVFEIREDKNLDIHLKGQTLNYITSEIINGLRKEFIFKKPNLVIVQGDTTTAFASALAAFYDKIPIGHVEAGLRTNNLRDPFPEEANRRLISQISTLHFAPTKKAKDNLTSSGIFENVFITGNTVIDALLMISPKVEKPIIPKISWENQRIIIVTAHRRENWDENIKQISIAIKTLLKRHSDISFIIPMHKNNLVRKPFEDLLSNNPRVLLIEPLEYEQLIAIMKNCYLILTDSGGIQEEAPSLGKPVLVLRNTSERMEAIELGTAKLIGTKTETIVDEVTNLLLNQNVYSEMSKIINPFGDGNSSKRILEICKKFLKEKNYL